MSEEVKVTEKKAARCVVESITVDMPTKSISFRAKLTGKIKSEDKWAIEDATTMVSGTKVLISDLLARVLIGWFWVRKIQDTLRKGTISDARARLNRNYDWTEETTTRKEAQKAPPLVVAQRAMDQMSAEELLAFIEQAKARAAELNEKKDEPK